MAESSSDKESLKDTTDHLSEVIPRRSRHVLFASIDDTPKDQDEQYIEDEYYLDGPGLKPVLHRVGGIHYGHENHHVNDTNLSARRKSMQIMTGYLTDHEGILKAEPGTGLFGPRIAIDPMTVRRRIINQKRPSVFQHIARIHHKFGIRHYVLVALLALYSALGGLIFLKLESEHEIKNLEQTRHTLIRQIENLTQEIFDIANVTVTPAATEDVIILIQEYYREMLKVEGKYSGSVYHKYERINMRLTWYYSSSVFFAMTLFTTIGYGTIAAQTVAGKVFTVIYATIGIPLMLVVLSDVGRVLLRFFTKAYNLFLKALSWIINWIKKIILRKDYNDNFEEQEFPLFLSIPILVGYLILCALIVTAFDYTDGLTPGLSTGDALYFSFISMSTIGLGDVMPNNIEYSPFLALMFLFGLALLSVVNSTVYEKMERKFLYYVDNLEDWLENIHFTRHRNQGYATFKALGANMQLLALALPIFDDHEEGKIESSLEAFHTDLGQKLFTRPRTRTNSLIEQNIEAFRPVLGIFSGERSFVPRRRANTSDCTIHHESDDQPQKSADSKKFSKGKQMISSKLERVQSDSAQIMKDSTTRLRTISEIV